MRAFVTRPQPEAQRWVAQLQAQRLPAEALPLIVIAPVPDAAPLHAAWQRLAGYRAAMFVSAAAVEYFFAACPAARGPAGLAIRFWAPGPGTARALRAAGVAQAQIDTPPADAAQFDSEALWQIAGAAVSPGDTVLVVRGSDGASGAGDSPGRGREWMAAQLRAAGAHVDYCVAYQRQAPQWTRAEADAIALRIAAESVLVFSSSEAIGHLLRLLPDSIAGPGTPIALCTHFRIAETARAAGFRHVAETRPAIDSVAGALRALAAAAAPC